MEEAKREEALRRALVEYDRQFRETGEAGEKAAELCLTLADLCMEQGNLHGADYYYAWALRYSRETHSGATEKDPL